MKAKEICYIFSYGGLGEFLFQLDLAKRLEVTGSFDIVIIARKNYTLFEQLIHASDLGSTALIHAPGKIFYLQAIKVALQGLFKKAWVVNSFDVGVYRISTILFYRVISLLGTKVLLYAYDKRLPAKTFYIERDEKEMIWKRNVRIVTKMKGAVTSEVTKFPILSFKTHSVPKKGYIHIHPVASIRERSYPPQKLLQLVRGLSLSHDVLVTYTPKEQAWYLSAEEEQELKAMPRVEVISSFFHPETLMGYINSSAVFCTMDTGLLWMSLFLDHPTVCFDIFTDYEWNPAPYGDRVVRLCHEYDEDGKSLFKEKRTHEDGVFFESMYRITPLEAKQAVDSLINK